MGCTRNGVWWMTGLVGTPLTLRWLSVGTVPVVSRARPRPLGNGVGRVKPNGIRFDFTLVTGRCDAEPSAF